MILPKQRMIVSNSVSPPAVLEWKHNDFCLNINVAGFGHSPKQYSIGFLWPISAMDWERPTLLKFKQKVKSLKTKTVLVLQWSFSVEPNIKRDKQQEAGRGNLCRKRKRPAAEPSPLPVGHDPDGGRVVGLVARPQLPTAVGAPGVELPLISERQAVVVARHHLIGDKLLFVMQSQDNATRGLQL